MLGHKPQKPIASGAITSSFENYSKHIMGALPRIVLGFALVFIGMIILGVGIMFLGVSPLKGSLLILLSWWVGWKEGWSKRISFFDEKFRKQIYRIPVSVRPYPRAGRASAHTRRARCLPRRSGHLVCGRPSAGRPGCFATGH